MSSCCETAGSAEFTSWRARRPARSSGFFAAPPGTSSLSLSIFTSGIARLVPFIRAQRGSVLAHLARRGVQHVRHGYSATIATRQERGGQRGVLDVCPGHVEPIGEEFEIDVVEQRLAFGRHPGQRELPKALALARTGREEG